MKSKKISMATKKVPYIGAKDNDVVFIYPMRHKNDHPFCLTKEDVRFKVQETLNQGYSHRIGCMWLRIITKSDSYCTLENGESVLRLVFNIYPQNKSYNELHTKIYIEASKIGFKLAYQLARLMDSEIKDKRLVCKDTGEIYIDNIEAGFVYDLRDAT